MGVILDTRINKSLQIFGALPQKTAFSCVPACVATALQIEWGLDAIAAQTHLIERLKTTTKGSFFELAASEAARLIKNAISPTLVAEPAVPLFGPLNDLLLRTFEGTTCIGIDASFLYQDVRSGGHAVLVASAMRVSDYQGFPRELLPQEIRAQRTWIDDPAAQGATQIKTDELEQAFESARRKFPSVANGLLIRTRP